VGNASSQGQTSGGRSVSTCASTELDLLGLASQAHEAYQLHDSHQAFFVAPADTTQSGGCLYHQPILLMGDDVRGGEQRLDPMARWLAEGHTEQCAILHLHDGRLSIHKECQCSDVSQPGMELVMEE
jgi:hypothetical protein